MIDSQNGFASATRSVFLNVAVPQNKILIFGDVEIAPRGTTPRIATEHAENAIWKTKGASKATIEI